MMVLNVWRGSHSFHPSRCPLNRIKCIHIARVWNELRNHFRGHCSRGRCCCSYLLLLSHRTTSTLNTDLLWVVVKLGLYVNLMMWSFRLEQGAWATARKYVAIYIVSVASALLMLKLMVMMGWKRCGRGHYVMMTTTAQGVSDRHRMLLLLLQWVVHRSHCFDSTDCLLWLSLMDLRLLLRLQLCCHARDVIVGLLLVGSCSCHSLRTVLVAILRSFTPLQSR